MKVHDLKCWPEPFQAIVDARKRHEFRRDDRAFEVGDLLLLREWNPDRADYTGRMLMVQALYISRGPEFDLPAGYAVISIQPIRLEMASVP